MPRKEPVSGERLVIMAGGVEHHLNDSLDMAVCRLKCADIHAKAARNRGADLLSVKLFPLDLTALEHISRQGVQDGLLTEVEAEGFHATDQSTLSVTNRRERFSKTFSIPTEPGPILKLMNIHSPHLLRRL